MAGEWQYHRIEEIAEKVGMGPFGSSILVSTFVANGIPVISGQHLHGSRLQDSTYNFITTEHAERLKNSNVFRGDVIFTHAGNIGQVAYIPESSRYERYVISQRQFYMRCNESKILPSFIVQYFKTPEGQHRLLANSTPSGVPSIAQPVTYLRGLEVPVPPLPEQRAIAHILGTLDDKIELNRRMNETLEAMARALFQSWFVNFDPVRAKAEGRDTGLPAHIADLFPDSFEESELGEIPKGWKVGTLGEVVGINVRSITKDYPYRVIQYVDISSVNEGTLSDPTEYDLKEAPSRAKRLVQNGDTIWSTVRPNRKSYLYINDPVENLVVSTGFVVLTPRLIPPTYLYAWVTTDTFVDYLAYNADGSAYPAVLPGRFASASILVAPDAVLDAFEDIVGTSRVRVACACEESRTLAALRDALLPRLISGELRVKDAEKMVEAAGM